MEFTGGMTFLGGMVVTGQPPPPTSKTIFGYGSTDGNPSGAVAITNLVSNAGVVATNTAGVGTARTDLAGAGYGTDKAIFGYGSNSVGTRVSMTNLVSNAGVVATDTAGVGTARDRLAAAGYGTDKAIFGYGLTIGLSLTAITNLVSNTGVVATDTAGVGTARQFLTATGYGTDKAMFAYGATDLLTTNLVSNTGVVAANTSASGTGRSGLAGAGYGSSGQAIFGYGYTATTDAGVSMTNLVSNTGVVATDTTGVGTARYGLAAGGYGGDKVIFGYGANRPASTLLFYSMTNLVSNTGVVATDTTGVGTARNSLAAASYGYTA